MKRWSIVIFFICVGAVIVGVKATMFSKTSDNGGNGNTGEDVSDSTFTMSNPIEENSASITKDSIRFTISVTKKEFRLGEYPMISLSVTNEGNENFSLIPVYDEFGYILYDEDLRSIYHRVWTVEYNFPPGMLENVDGGWLWLSPGESYSASVHLDPYDVGISLVPGRYYIRGVMGGGMRTPLLPITVS